MRERTPAEKELKEFLEKETESVRFAVFDAGMKPEDPLVNLVMITRELRELIRAVKDLKESLGVKQPSLAEDVKVKTKPTAQKHVDRVDKAKAPTPKKEPPPFATFQLTPETLAKLFIKPEEAKSVITQRLLDAGCPTSIDKLVEMGYIENVRRYECRLRVNG